MLNRYHNHFETEQPRARQVGDPQPARSGRLQAAEQAPPASPELDELVEQVRWVMRRDPIRERGRGAQAI